MGAEALCGALGVPEGRDTGLRRGFPGDRVADSRPTAPLLRYQALGGCVCEPNPVSSEECLLGGQVFSHCVCEWVCAHLDLRVFLLKCACGHVLLPWSLCASLCACVCAFLKVRGSVPCVMCLGTRCLPCMASSTGCVT